jgi:hypothetical protein
MIFGLAYRLCTLFEVFLIKKIQNYNMPSPNITSMVYHAINNSLANMVIIKMFYSCKQLMAILTKHVDECKINKILFGLGILISYYSTHKTD